MTNSMSLASSIALSALVYVLGGAISTVDAQEFPWANVLSDGFRQSARIQYVEPSENPPALTERKDVLTPQVVEDLKREGKRIGSRAVIVAMDNAVIYESYAAWGGSRQTPLGMSMSKSLTALAVGQALCQNHIRSLDDKVNNYVPALSDTSWGNASVKDILKMSSGAYSIGLAFNGHKTREMEATLGPSLLEGRMNQNFADLMRLHDESSFPPGERWHYNNFDTIALGLLVEAATKMPFAIFFENSIWQPAGTQAKGAWVINNKKQSSNYHGFSARPADWLRLGIWVLQELEKTDSCFGKFLKEATSRQITSYGPAGEYGYQIWVNCASGIDFCFVGYGGQYLVFNRTKRMVAYHHAATLSSSVYGTPSYFGKIFNSIAAR